MLAYSLRVQNVRADILCFISEDISDNAEKLLTSLFDHVVRVPSMVVDGIRDQKRQYLPYVFTRLHALRLGSDGGLGFSYEKVAILDADIMPIRHYDHLFLLEPPGAILNEQADHLKDQAVLDRNAAYHGRWCWHQEYAAIPHGSPVPASVTDRVRTDPTNYGMNTALLLIRPSEEEFLEIREDVQRYEVRQKLATCYRWPDMQYLTVRWSGAWRNIDLCYAGMNGYPDIDFLFGTHFAGTKPWHIKNKTIQRRFWRFKDYRFWYGEFLRMMNDYPVLRRCKKLREIESFAREKTSSRSA
jgi:glycogenin glucosyltransferase